MQKLTKLANLFFQQRLIESGFAIINNSELVILIENCRERASIY
jgi:hypothetical protein